MFRANRLVPSSGSNYHVRRMKKRYNQMVKEWKQLIEEGKHQQADILQNRMDLWWQVITNIEKSKID